ncbi:ATP-dependent Clp protease ATP-binding subunit [Xanthocytophaga flava]|uniref:ATP-dependent Clp protease ATP-binding subunit n=1 Tax=Xanthocytophaga flava TaxID=3048013 RepID=UPI0028D60677|nr:ATP-dependent Clp protease ATP-binding subunit [Xanthocytophaga flavus]MDJ1469684.1 ATP-dependent Clp protease ATP-binding subunit [Xanthocytophaga flavus]
MNTILYSDTIQQIIHIAQSYASEYKNEYIEPAHLLRAAMHNETSLKGFVSSLGHDPYFITEWAEVRMEDLPKQLKTGHAEMSTLALSVLDEADTIRGKLGLEETTAICLLAALCKPHLGFSSQQLKTFPLKEKDILAPFLERNSQPPNFPLPSTNTGLISEKADALTRYCQNKTLLAAAGKLDPIIGRDRELRMMIEILSRRNKSHVLLLGEPGVGKSALIEGFAQNISKGNIPLLFKEIGLYELNLSSLAAGATYKGEVEDRLQQVIAEIKRQGKGILLIEELHTLLDTKNPMYTGIASLLKPELARNEIIFIGTTTIEDYRKTIEPDKAFSRRFEIITLQEPDEATCIKILEIASPTYEQHHQIVVKRESFAECIRLSKRYMKDKHLPDGALDLLDMTMASIKLTGETSSKDINVLQQQFEAICNNTDWSETEQARELKWLHNELTNRISPILLGMLTDETDFKNLETTEEIKLYLTRKLSDLHTLSQQKFEQVDKNELAAIVAYKTGIPIGKIQSQEKERLINMEEYLKRRVIGQDHGLKVITDAIIENRSGINKPGQPIGSFFLLGPTGTGKTELTKSIAEFLFNDEKAMIRFDMSEFKEEHSAALLYGAPPGYVGYEEGGMLVNKIRENPYSVVLFDEIEKAHRSVFDIFLQIMDEGVIHDKLGKEGDFSNALIIFTSNIGSDWIVEKFNNQEMPKQNELLEIMSRHFRPEFLGRLTEIIPFAPINENNVVRILEVQIQSLLSTLNKMGIELELTPEAKKHLATNGFTPQYGARPISGIIRNQIRRPLSRKLIAGQINKGDKVILHYKNEELLWQSVSTD